jgi:hypothetical protein
MDRVKAGGYTPLIEAAYSIVPMELHHLIQADFLCGTDPLFAGLHGYGDASYGRSYTDTMHVAYPHHQGGLAKAHRRTTVVIPGPAKEVQVKHLVHELGHVLHESLAWDHDATPVSRYAETNWCEAFAEAFTSWLIPGYAARPDDATVAYFDSMATGALPNSSSVVWL